MCAQGDITKGCKYAHTSQSFQKLEDTPKAFRRHTALLTPWPWLSNFQNWKTTSLLLLLKTLVWAGKMAQQGEELSAKPGNLSLIPQTHRVEGEDEVLKVVLTSTHIRMLMNKNTHTSRHDLCTHTMTYLCSWIYIHTYTSCPDLCTHVCVLTNTHTRKHTQIRIFKSLTLSHSLWNC